MGRWKALQPHLDDGVPLARAAADAGVALRSARRWLAWFRRDGLAGLARAPRSDRGTRRLEEDLVGLVEGLVLRRPAPSVATVHRTACAVATERGWPLPSYSTVWRVARALDEPLLALAQRGTRAYEDAYDLVYRREAGRPNDIWQADHTPLDILVVEPSSGTGTARPWLTVVLDDYSRAVPGYALNLSGPSAMQTALVLRQAIWRKPEPAWRVCGVPGVLYVDNGSDFTSSHIETVCAELHVRLVHSAPGRARGRGKVERLFDSVNQLFLPGLPGHLVEGRAVSPPKLTLPELDRALKAFIVNDYHQREHSETGQAPAARWEASGFVPQLPEHLEDLDMLLLSVPRPRVVHPDGIHFQGLRYLDVGLAAYVGEAVTVRYDPRDLTEVRVFHEGKFICAAVCPGLSATTVSLKELVAARNRRRRELREEVKRHQSLVEELLAVHQPEPTTLHKHPRLKRYRDE